MAQTFKQQLAELYGTRDFENLDSRLGKKLGGRIKSVLKRAELIDKELDIAHAGLQACYEFDKTAPIVKETLNQIESLTP